jgi:hypothetical protein
MIISLIGLFKQQLKQAFVCQLRLLRADDIDTNCCDWFEVYIYFAAVPKHVQRDQSTSSTWHNHVNKSVLEHWLTIVCIAYRFNLDTNDMCVIPHFGCYHLSGITVLSDYGHIIYNRHIITYKLLEAHAIALDGYVIVTPHMFLTFIR